MKQVEQPRELRDGLERLARSISPQQLNSSAADLSARYRAADSGGLPVARSHNDAVAYALYRFPATYAAIVTALEALREQRKDCAPRSVLDLGSGSGAGIWAAASVWPGLERVRAVDAMPPMIAVGRTLSGAASHPALRSAQWVESDLVQAQPTESSDLVVLAYVLGELDRSRVPSLLDLAWQAAGEALVIVEPGTPAGAERVREARNQLVDQGAHSVAPCPNDLCWQQGGDWMHFAVRLPRSRLHRVAKAGEMAFEDEKFSYVAFTRTPAARDYSRVIRHPQFHKGHVQLELCTPDGLKKVVISKRDGKLYQRARKASWGDVLEMPDGTTRGSET